MDDTVKLAIQITENGQAAAAGIAETSSSLDRLGDSATDVASNAGKTARAISGLSKGLSLIGADGAAKDLQEAGQALQFVKGAGTAVKLALDATKLATEGSTAATIAKTVVEKASAAATAVMTGAQWALNAALDANPIGLIIIAVIALVAGIILLYKHSETARKIIDTAMHGIAAAAGFVVDFIRDHWKLILAILTGPIGAAVILIATHWDQIRDGAKVVLQWVDDHWKDLKSDLTQPISDAKQVISQVWADLQSGASDAEHAIGGFFQGIADDVQAVIDKVQGVIDKIGDLAGKVKDAGSFLGAVGLRTSGGQAYDIPNSGLTRDPRGDVHLHFHGYAFVGNEPELARQIKQVLRNQDSRLGT